MATTLRDKMLGCLYGQAIGDALGLGTEFLNKEQVRAAYPNGLTKYEDIIQDAHRCRWHKGAWTDDTDMMICIMKAFENGRFDVSKIAHHFKDWFEGEPLGIGSHTFKVLCMNDYVEQPELCSKLWWKLSNETTAANGALMRTSVVGLAPDDVEEQAVNICKLTHYDPRCIGSCVIATDIIHELVWNDRELPFEEIISIGNRYDKRIAGWIDSAYQSKEIAALDLDEPHSIGYTLRTLAAALWCYWHATSFEDGLIKVVNEGGDADTNAAIACAILGAKFGFATIPQYYVTNLHNATAYYVMVENFTELVTNDHI